MAEELRALKQQVCASIDGAEDKLHRLGDAIWRHPELAYEERQAHETLVRFFTQEQGWTVEAHYGLETAFRATWGPVGGGDSKSVINVGFLCEYDALPAIGHACGHNLIAESGVAAALGLKAALESMEAWPMLFKVCQSSLNVIVIDVLWDWTTCGFIDGSVDNCVGDSSRRGWRWEGGPAARRSL